MATLNQARQWIEINVDSSDEALTEGTDAALLWFEAVSRAECMRDFSQREMAQELLAGIPAITLEDVAESIADWSDEDLALHFRDWFQTEKKS